MPVVYSGPHCMYNVVDANAIVSVTLPKAPTGYKNVVNKVIVGGQTGAGASNPIDVKIAMTNLSLQTGYPVGSNTPDTGYFYGDSYTLGANKTFGYTFDFGGAGTADGGIPLNFSDEGNLITTTHLGSTLAELSITVFWTVLLK